MVALGYNEYGTSSSYQSLAKALTDTLLPVTQGGDWGGLVSVDVCQYLNIVTSVNHQDYTKDC